MVALVGALSNQPERLVRLDRVRRKLLSQAKQSPRSPKPLRSRAGAIQNGVVEVLAATAGPMRFMQVHAAVEQLLGRPVDKGTVKDCLWKGAHSDEPRFERLARGLYRLRKT